MKLNRRKARFTKSSRYDRISNGEARGVNDYSVHAADFRGGKFCNHFLHIERMKYLNLNFKSRGKPCNLGVVVFHRHRTKGRYVDLAPELDARPVNYKNSSYHCVVLGLEEMNFLPAQAAQWIASAGTFSGGTTFCHCVSDGLPVK